MVRAVTTRSKARTINITEEKKNPPSLDTEHKPVIDEEETSSNTHDKKSRDISIKEMQSTDPFCKCIMKRLLKKLNPNMKQIHSLFTMNFYTDTQQITPRTFVH